MLLAALCDIVPPSVWISAHSRRAAGALREWLASSGLSARVDVAMGLPDLDEPGCDAIIVATAASDHERAVEWCLEQGVPTLVEKPIAPSGIAAQRMARLARARGDCLAASQVFLYARYVEKFAELTGAAGSPEELEIDWSDPPDEQRYGQRKHYDPALTVFADCLPHIVALAGALVDGVPVGCHLEDVEAWWR